MDSVRFGRALGAGARAAAKTLATAADAAAAPHPSSARRPEAQRPSPSPQPSSQQFRSSSSAASRPVATVTEQVTRTATQAVRATEGVARGGKRFGESVWRPFVRLSGVLWLEFTGVFFGIFALFAGTGAWKLRGSLHETATNHEDHIHFVMAALMAVVFAYFCISSFVRAGRRERAR